MFKIQVLFIFVSVLGLTLSQHHQQQPQQEQQRQQQYNHQEDYDDSDASYNFAYAVDDEEHNDFKSHQETRTGKEVQGVYTVKQPDGRTRIVRYTVGPHTGFNAVVEYVGESNIEPQQSFQYNNQRSHDSTQTVQSQHQTVAQDSPTQQQYYQPISSSLKYQPQEWTQANSQPKAIPKFTPKNTENYQTTPKTWTSFIKPQELPKLVKKLTEPKLTVPTPFQKQQIEQQYAQKTQADSNSINNNQWNYVTIDKQALQNEQINKVPQAEAWTASRGIATQQTPQQVVLVSEPAQPQGWLPVQEEAVQSTQQEKPALYQSAPQMIDAAQYNQISPQQLMAYYQQQLAQQKAQQQRAPIVYTH